MTREEESIKYLQTINESLKQGKLIDTLTGDKKREAIDYYSTPIEALQFLDKYEEIYENVLAKRLGWDK